jgi:hypothetical protein
LTQNELDPLGYLDRLALLRGTDEPVGMGSDLGQGRGGLSGLEEACPGVEEV